MAQLQLLDNRVSTGPEDTIPTQLQEVTTTLVYSQWAEQLQSHPDHNFSSYVLRGISQGFRIGFDYNRAHPCTSARSNMQSALQCPLVVDEYLEQEVSLNRVMGPLPMDSIPGVHVNRIGVIPKKHQPGKWRLIVDMSHPEGRSANDGIEPELCSLKYISVDDAVRLVLELGQGTLLAKLDIQSAYRIIPVHPSDRKLLGMSWRGQLFVDSVLPFGLRSAPIIFTAVADALQWVLESKGVSHILHYLDDFLLLGPPASPACKALAKTL